jgi:excisionase family DNA binding protein
MEKNDKFFTLAELCTYLGISRSLAYKLSHRCIIPKYRPTNGRVWFKKSEVDIWLDKHRILSEEEINTLIN